jgi:hypothetical protein
MNPTTSDAVKAGAFTALWAFIALFGATLLGWTADVIDWAQDWGTTGVPADFPNMSVLAAGAISALGSAAAGLVGTIVRLAQAKTSVVPGQPPVYDHPTELG